ncbi:C6 zinc finger domain containing protein [Lasiodiplodia theobromae]|uniref:C6 zinc finger domain containing protein n=1 Tax=Lasiodiplodia theobromae TaxID=45133 RepID=UPI0015C3FA31|nr:C6 zinc finger domain containing protein [Lasiodiplodia theobromae]KAF4538173.1 C6 zinc finger domain containing protein [Lasiodiplodia theobromae]
MNEGLFNPVRSGIEYIDGWMLTGYAAQKAMLSISFSKIVANIKNGEPTVEDTAAVRLWSHICLYHLHWAATTGRPSTIPTSYLKHCNIILNFYDGTLEDSLILAEIALYESVLQKMNERPSLHSEDEEFAEWKQKWNYLLSLPTSSFLKIGYSSACLILTTKWLEDLGDDLRSAAFLSNSPLGNDAPVPSRTQHSDKTNPKAALLSLRARSLMHARSILETFLQMPHFLKNGIMSNRCLCLGYSALILAHYGELHSDPQDKHSLHLVSRLEDWLSKAPGKSAVIKFATMAKQRLMTRLSSGPANDEALGLTSEKTSTKENNRSYSLHPASDGATAVDTTGYETHGDATFPNMEEFFSGGFLGFQFE